jgi:hypothetical protein
MSALGGEFNRSLQQNHAMSALPPKADIDGYSFDVR